ncbi:MAG: hypothetical protein ABI904_16830 [Chloroflexota bacterium]
MKQQRHLMIILIVLSLTIFLAACGNATPETKYIIVTATILPTDLPTEVSATNTPDPCSSENIQAEVQKVHKFMREFDDASSLAASRPREQLADAIASLQTIRRDAEDQPIPACLGNLKTYQISHMNAVINTLIAFMGGTDQKNVDQGISQARQLHDQYTIELARVLGITMVPATLSPVITQTPSP